MTSRSINTFMAFRLPAAFLCGVRAQSLSDSACVAAVRHRWINQNPFGSMYFAVQAMAAELTTGALLLSEIRKLKVPVSMLVAKSEAVYHKKAVGHIRFTCSEGEKVRVAVRDAIRDPEGATVALASTGTNEAGETVSEMTFTWTLRMKR
jgi:hypothetical protein